MKDSSAATSKRDNAGVAPAAAATEAPPGWAEAQKTLAAEFGMALLLVAGHQPPALAVSNNNSICHAFQSSEEHKHLCEPYCGKAYERAQEAGTASYYRCHAGLQCVALPVEIEKRKLAVIGGRAFLKSADYRAVAERIRAGDLQDLLSDDLFKNIIFAAQQDLESIVPRITRLAAERASLLATGEAVETAAPNVATTTIAASASADVQTAAPSVPDKDTDEDSPTIADASSVYEDEELLPGLSLEGICRAAEKVLTEKHELTSFALLINERGVFAPALAVGRFQKELRRLEFTANDPSLSEAAREGRSLFVYETAEGLLSLRISAAKPAREESKRTIELFPLILGHEAKDALLVTDAKLTATKRSALLNFGRSLALPLEILRLRGELERHTRAANNLRDFTEIVNTATPAESYLSILQHSTELVQAERGSLLLFDEASNELAVKASVGFHTEAATDARVRLGDSISGTALQQGSPIVVRDVQTAGYKPAPAERRYKTKSFISYPILIRGRKVGVLNVTDKAGGAPYDDVDLSLLDSIAPQVALALDRAEWSEKAAQYQLMSITDPLTGLLNRRYLEERLAEELNRSKRQGFAMSFMMLDIDDFKPYNDRNGHQAGDLALEMTAQCLKSALRSADVASRYGGEEFSILLPQTSLPEAQEIAERIRRRMERTRFPHGKTQPLGAVTLSIGLSAYDAALATPASIIGAADRALYVAKSQGKNRVVSHEPQPEDPSTESPQDADAAT
ncbi:MAG: diguanylate cyclase [Pyrinomonadaceae bacterium]